MISYNPTTISSFFHLPPTCTFRSPRHVALLIKGPPTKAGLSSASQPLRDDSSSTSGDVSDVIVPFPGQDIPDGIDPSLAEQYAGGYPLVVVQAPSKP
jgi:hypothetical protein